MARLNRVPGGVAKDLLTEYGYHGAVVVISMRLKSHPAKADVEFWLDVLAQLDGCQRALGSDSPVSMGETATNNRLNAL